MILVFGKTGQVATELQRQAEVTALSRDRADLSDPQGCAAIIADLKPNVVINAAAYTAVDRAEEDEATAQTINAAAPGAMAGTCKHLDIPLLHVSTDYVFDGTGDRPWCETDPVQPQNAYGRTKLAGEEAVRASGARHILLRTAWVFSAHGTNFVKTMLRLSETRDALTVVEDQIGGPTPAADIAATLLTLADAMRGGAEGGTYHYAGAPHTSWAGFAREIFAQAGKDVTVTGIPSSDYPTPAHRPLNSRLDCAKLTSDFGITPADWQGGLSRVLKELTSEA
ncbi:dTDP-4-dehydrorhamnose reductase [Marivita hallyeonensis]|uniref:dTDP-4-dehydrorhamnose reductase n=1 Tax=Marivita hallyeonensis TaxID=996342 RepID=A0A1M5Y5V0_9RHOB|nr:dTDP-4-dehydrorhamnose reductase [Marivita hallyeonensis]SHI07455.1 dTDP-4-dehydrorhamnose reductase [Marivita hallyeonensis]